jgi:hypothetical protein
MPRRGSIALYAYEYLSTRRTEGATLYEIRLAVEHKKKHPVLPHSLRAAMYTHLDEAGEGLFERAERSRYRPRTKAQ